MEPSATKAFLLVMASCGFRPVEIKRTEPSMIHHKDQDPYVIRNTAKGGDVVAVPLSDVGVLAWRMWLEQNPWNGAREQRVMQTYALLRVRADTLGPEIRPVNIDCTSPERRDPALNKNPCGFRSPSRTAASGTAVTIPMLASLLDARLGTLVTDETALRGQFDLTLTWSPDGAAAVDGVSLFTAVQEQLGLKLEARRIPVDVVAIKRVERPTEN